MLSPGPCPPDTTISPLNPVFSKYSMVLSNLSLNVAVKFSPLIPTPKTTI